MSTKETILVLCIILYSVNQASSLKCYICSSKSDGSCYTEPKKKEFEKECPPGNHVKSAYMFPESANPTLIASRKNVSAMNHNELSKASDSMECYTATGNGTEGKLIVRDCIDRTYSNDYIIQLASIAGATIESIYRCHTDLCNTDYPTTTSTTSSPTSPSPGPPSTNAPNSSRALSTAFLSLAGSLLSICVTKL